jgi:hypothetical protein
VFPAREPKPSKAVAKRVESGRAFWIGAAKPPSAGSAIRSSTRSRAAHRSVPSSHKASVY